jgi:Zn-dependent peptidase ImmA (M78 family)
VRLLLGNAGVVEAPVPVERIARDLGVIVRYQPFAGQLSGMIVPAGETCVIGVNSLEAPVRQRFTLAHELGHFHLHPEKEFVDRSFATRFRNERSSAGVDTEEIQANRFAAELLMPIDFLHADIADEEIDVADADELIERLAKRYQVSKQAMTIRLTTLGLGSALGIE